MDNHFTITINDDNGIRQFTLHQIIKKTLIYIVLFVAFIALSAVGIILYLDDSLSEAQQKNLGTQSAYEQMKYKNTELDLSIKQTQQALLDNQKKAERELKESVERSQKKLDKSIRSSQKALEIKKQELTDLSDTLSQIETLIGMSPVANAPLAQRVNSTKMTSQEMATMMQFIPSGSPIKFTGVTSKFGNRVHPVLKRKEFHRGLDMKAKMKTPVYATADGIVEYAGFHKKSGFGRLVILQHNYGFRAYFGHLKKIVIKSGKFVKKGDLIAYTGSSGMSSGPHLHYEIRFLHRALNPIWFVKWDIQNYKQIFEKEKKIPWQSLITATAHIKVLQPTQTPLSSQLAQISKER